MEISKKFFGAKKEGELVLILTQGHLKTWTKIDTNY